MYISSTLGRIIRFKKLSSATQKTSKMFCQYRIQISCFQCDLRLLFAWNSVSQCVINHYYGTLLWKCRWCCRRHKLCLAKNFRRVVFRIRKHFWLLSTGKWYFSTPLRSPVVPVEGERPLFFYTPAMKFQWMVDPHLRVEWTQLLLGFRLIWRRFSECYLPSAKFLWPRG
jgi:hypothetical protein